MRCTVNALLVFFPPLFVKLKFMFVVNLLFSQLYFTRKNALKASLFAIILFTRLIQGECIHPLTLNWVMGSIVLAAFPQNEPKCAKTQDVFGTRST